MLKIDVVYAAKDSLLKKELTVAQGTTVLQAIQLAKLQQFLLYNNEQIENIGIFSKKVLPDTLVQAGDRIEIYRPLLADPKEARRKKILLNSAKR